MHPTLKKAIDKAEEILTDMTGEPETISAERARGEAMSKEDLINEILILKAKKRRGVTVEDMAYAIMEEPECAALSFPMIAAIIVKFRPGRTKGTNISWYASKAIEKERDVVPRICQAEFNKLIISSV